MFLSTEKKKKSYIMYICIFTRTHTHICMGTYVCMYVWEFWFWFCAIQSIKLINGREKLELKRRKRRRRRRRKDEKEKKKGNDDRRQWNVRVQYLTIRTLRSKADGSSCFLSSLKKKKKMAIFLTYHSFSFSLSRSVSHAWKKNFFLNWHFL